MYIRKKKNAQGKEYAYEVRAYWDKEKKQSRSKSKYIGRVDSNGDIIPKGRKKIRKKDLNNFNEGIIEDFGDSYFVKQLIERSEIYPHIKGLLSEVKEVLPLILYRLCNPGAMYNCELWYNSTVIHRLCDKANLSSQNISKVIQCLGRADIQKSFFKSYLSNKKEVENSVVIDATSLPNEINTGMKGWGYNNGSICEQYRLHCVIDADNKKPLYYRYVNGSICDVSTLENTISELSDMGVKKVSVLLDAGYFSEKNIRLLNEKNIDYLIRLPSGRKQFKDLIKDDTGLEEMDNCISYSKRAVFIDCKEIKMYENKVYAYKILDPAKKAKDLNALFKLEEEEKLDKKQKEYMFKRAGVFILISTKKILNKEILNRYYMRQSVEQVFGFAKSELDLLPIRVHSDQAVSGYLFLQFIVLCFFIELRNKVSKFGTVEQVLLKLRALKSKTLDESIIIQEPNKNIKDIFNSINSIVPSSLGI